MGQLIEESEGSAAGQPRELATALPDRHAKTTVGIRQFEIIF